MPLLLLVFLLMDPPTAAIKVDQVGYLPDAPKVAIVAADSAVRTFTLRREPDGKVVFTGTLGEPVNDANSGDRVQAADFSSFRIEGRYALDVPGVGRSYPFTISKQAFGRAWYLAMRSFYGQRCGTTVDLGPEFPGFRYGACHTKGAFHASAGRKGERASEYGWHDAGDYGRYVVNSGLSTGTLLWTYELFGKRVGGVRLNIPESGNGTPDVLNEVRWNLQWMLSMQDGDGGVWHKQTSERFAAFVMPDKDAAPSVVVGTGMEPFKSSCASGDFAAVMAIAQRTYAPFDKVFAERAGVAAAKAWQWMATHPNVRFRNPAGVATGEYGDANCADERLWAAAELWRSTGREEYQRYFLENYQSYLANVRPPGWPNVGSMALWTYVLGPKPNSEAAEAIRAATRKAATAIVERTRTNPYRIAMVDSDYVWGSNSQAANYSLLLLVANAIQPERKFVEAAMENLHYLLGRNTFSMSWVTAVGSNWFLHPHHRPSGADGIEQPWPGLLSGGPNRGRQDDVLRKLPTGLPPMKSWVDAQSSYAGNEVAINWNAPLVFALAGILPEGSDGVNFKGKALRRKR